MYESLELVWQRLELFIKLPGGQTQVLFLSNAGKEQPEQFMGEVQAVQYDGQPKDYGSEFRLLMQ